MQKLQAKTKKQARLYKSEDNKYFFLTFFPICSLHCKTDPMRIAAREIAMTKEILNNRLKTRN